MKTTNSNTKNINIGILFLIILLAASYPSFSQNKLVSLVDFNFVLPVICVLGLAIFLITAFMKQKNH